MKRFIYISVKNTHGVTFLHGCFLRFLNYANGTKSRKALHLICHSYNCLRYMTSILSMHDKILARDDVDVIAGLNI